ncbi:MAG TPA: glycosyltransferase family 4 protein [Verrucomicrobiae bacterium]|nr:glycosyltransferase family 4 protein [Verrucomicrobiae bacterium]
MKIVLLCNEYPPRPNAAGIGVTVQTLARGLSQRGHDVTVVGLGESDEEHFDFDVRVITLRTINLRYLGGLISRVKLRRWLTAYVKAEQIDIVEAPDSLGLLPFGLKGCPVAIRLHLSFTAVEKIAGERAGPGVSFYERRTLAANRNWIPISDYVMSLTESTFGISAERSMKIRSALPPPPPEMPTAPSLPENYILYAGNVCRRKGADVLAKAARRVMAERPDLHLVYVGGVLNENGRTASELVREIVGPELTPRVHFLGRLERGQVLACMAGARVFAFPSQIESLALVVVEAMSCGTPVVFTKLPPGPEIVQDGVTGLLADPRSPDDFADKIVRILDDPELAGRLGRAARDAAQSFSVEQCISSTERFYEELCGNNHGAVNSAIA